MLVLILIPIYSVHFRTEGYDLQYLRISKRNLKPSKTNSPLGKHPNNLMPYKTIFRYGIGALLTATPESSVRGGQKKNATTQNQINKYINAKGN